MPNNFGRYIDHTLLRPTAGPADVGRLCREAIGFSMAAVCVFPTHVSLAREGLAGTSVRIATVVSFPFGMTFTDLKAAELRASVGEGANEADFVINISRLKSGGEADVLAEMEFLANLCRDLSVTSKFIVETGYLSDEEKVLVCEIANRAFPDYLKTSTGYGPSGATVGDVKLLRSILRPEIQIKAAGGIRSYAQAAALLEAGASRIGTSSGVAIVEESLRL